MKDALRDVDDLGRYGGDEFLALLPGSDGPGALAASERLRDAVSALGPRPVTANSGTSASAWRRSTIPSGTARS